MATKSKHQAIATIKVKATDSGIRIDVAGYSYRRRTIIIRANRQVYYIKSSMQCV
jgi:hypothetical protein